MAKFTVMTWNVQNLFLPTVEGDGPDTQNALWALSPNTPGLTWPRLSQPRRRYCRPATSGSQLGHNTRESPCNSATSREVKTLLDKGVSKNPQVAKPGDNGLKNRRSTDRPSLTAIVIPCWCGGVRPIKA
jgi:hypothetical protein